MLKHRLSPAGKRFQKRVANYATITLRVGPDIAHKLRSMAQNENITLQAAIVNCILIGLDKYAPPQQEMKFD